MSHRSRKVILFILGLTTNKSAFLFWLGVRFLSAILPLITIYQFSEVIKQIETKQETSQILLSVALIFLVRLLDNFLRLKSVTRLEYEISNITFDIHKFFLFELNTSTKEERHACIQAVRNFTEASSTTLNLIKQPGIDSLVSLICIPIILYILDFNVFIVTCAYILIYYFIDYYTTQRYADLKDILNNKTELYFAKLQDSNDFELEQKTWSRHNHRLTNWGFHEWSLLQNTAVFFYSVIFLYLVYLTSIGAKQLSDVVLIMGYITQTHLLLNSFSTIQDSLTDMHVGLERLATNQSVSAVDLDDLI